MELQNLSPYAIIRLREAVFKKIRWKIPVVTTKSTFLQVDSQSRLILPNQYNAVFMKKGLVSADFSIRVDSLWK
jgi:hypothetical protein